MKRFTRASQSLLLLSSLSWGVGCDKGPVPEEASTAEATVKGMVNIDGKPASGGEVVFDPSNSMRSVARRTAPISPSGSFEIKTLIGNNTVKLDGPLTRKNQILQHQQQSFKVETGENSMTFDAVSK